MAKRKLDVTSSGTPGMHPSNPYYNNPPNFLELAERYPTFRPYVFFKSAEGDVDADPGRSGKGSINFRDPNALRELTYTLLKNDFSLNLEIPLDSLCPAVPNRVNYICWIEDVIQPKNHERIITGIDIGTGASCIYPLLGCRRNKGWRMVGTDIDSRSISFARKNINQNKLEDHISILMNNSGKAFPDSLFDGDKRYDFSMCNPPFYDDEKDIQESLEIKEAPPSAVCQGTQNEMITTGGEVQFVIQMIGESIHLQGKIGWYSSMLGKRSSLDKVVAHLKQNNISNYILTTFHQGRTTRWAIAWSFLEERPFKPSAQNAPRKMARLAAPTPILSFLIRGIALSIISGRLKLVLDSLSIEYELGTESENDVVFCCQARSNTWSRAARRAKAKAKEVQMSEKNDGTSSMPSALAEVSLAVILKFKIILAGAESITEGVPGSISQIPRKSDALSDTKVDVVWTFGKDRAIFEACFLHLRSRLQDPL